MKLKIGILGAGKFGSCFVPVFQKHPDVEDVYLADINKQRLAEKSKALGVKKTFNSLDELCASDCNCIAIFTQRWQHAPQAVQALKAGKHVYSAVPAAVTLAEIDELVNTVKQTGMIYMLGETSYYRPQSIYCRKRFAAGDFGEFVYGEGQYHHDMSHFYASYMHSNGDNWKSFASFPPMLYATHSTAFVLGVTFRRMTKVSCFGFKDDHADGIFNKEISRWQNEHSNQSALFRTSDGGAARVNEFRRVGSGSDGRRVRSSQTGMEITGDGRMSIAGTLASYNEQEGSSVYTHLDIHENYRKNGEIDYARTNELVGVPCEDVSDIRNFDGIEITEENLGNFPRRCIGKKFQGLSKVQPFHELPAEFMDVPNGHAGTNVFLVNDFVRCVRDNKLPQNNVWQAARYNAPGIVALESARKDGELLKIPDFGMPTDARELLDPMAALKP
jgi:predicted dehydrogenase